MALKYSTGFKDAVLATGSVKSVFENGGAGFIKIYAGPVPAFADDALSGHTELVTYSDSITPANGLTLEAVPVDGAIAKLGTQIWQGTCGNTDTAAYFRYWQTGDTLGASTTLIRIQGTVGGAGADLYVASTTFTDTIVYTLDLFSLAIPDS
jgi:hypothetical protein